MSLNLIKQLNQQRPNKQKRNWLCKQWQEGCSHSVYKAIERFKQPVEQHHKEPVNGQFEDCTKEVLPGVETESSSDEEDQNITTE